MKKDSIHKGKEKNFYTFFSRLQFTFHSFFFPCAFSSNFFISPLCIIRFEIGHIGPVLVLQQIFENALFKTWKTDMQRLSKNHVCRKCVFLSVFSFVSEFILIYDITLEDMKTIYKFFWRIIYFSDIAFKNTKDFLFVT